MEVGTYSPDNLIAGSTALVTEAVTVASSAKLVRGSVLGNITASGKYILSTSAAEDGSQTPAVVLVEDCDASTGDVANVAVFVKGEFNENALTLGEGHTIASVKAPLREGGIYIKTSVGA